MNQTTKKHLKITEIDGTKNYVFYDIYVNRLFQERCRKIGNARAVVAEIESRPDSGALAIECLTIAYPMQLSKPAVKQTAANNEFLRGSKKLWNQKIFKKMSLIFNQEGKASAIGYLQQFSTSRLS